MSRDVIEIEWVCAGQPRPYADSVYEAYITWRREDGLLPDSQGRTAYYLRHDEGFARRIARLLVADWSDHPNWHESRLDFIRPTPATDEMRAKSREKWPPTRTTRWHVRVVQPYLD